MQTEASADTLAADRAQRHGAVYRALTGATDRTVAPGLEGAIGRAQVFYARLGDADALALLAAISLAVFRLRQALFAGDAEACAAQREILAAAARDWLYHAPLFSLPDLVGAEGSA